jgi:ABC-2 type transport system ATP-binding protein
MVVMIIDVQGVDKAFGATKALSNIDLQVAEGTVLGLLGPNGAGKTTLVRILATLLLPDAGTARVAGLDVVHDAAKVRTLIGLAGQFAAVDETLTGRENLEIVGRLYQLGKLKARSRAAEVLERMSLTDAADRTVRTYSGGMRRRLDVGASLVGRPRVLILDEPTTGLDPRTRLDLWDFIRDLVADGTTVLLTTQYLEEADVLANRIVVIDQGRTIAEGTADELKDRMGGDVLDLQVADAGRLGDAAELVVPLGREKPQIDREDRRVTVGVTGGPATLLAAVRAFDDAGIVLTDLGVRRPSLDDVFLALTGHSATQAATDAPPARRGRPERKSA